MPKSPRDAAQALRERAEALATLPQRAGRSVASVQGHRGDSTVSVASTGKGASVTITGTDAREHRAAVHADVLAALRKER